MNVNQAFPSQYLKVADVGDSEPVVTIERVELEEVGRTKEVKPVMYFAGKRKGLVLNKTNAKRIAELVGSPETEDWIGHRIRLFATSTEFSGETVECLRVKAANGAPPAVVPPRVAPDDLNADDIPF